MIEIVIQPTDYINWLPSFYNMYSVFINQYLGDWVMNTAETNRGRFTKFIATQPFKVTFFRNSKTGDWVLRFFDDKDYTLFLLIWS